MTGVRGGAGVLATSVEKRNSSSIGNVDVIVHELAVEWSMMRAKDGMWC